MTDVTHLQTSDDALRPLSRTQVLTLRAEGLVQLGLALALFSWSGESWWLFAALILAPDLAFLGYLAGPRAGAAAYNAVHSYVPAGVLLGAGALAGLPLLLGLGAILWAHIGLDRAIGYGLKHADTPRRTHLDLPPA